MVINDRLCCLWLLDENITVMLFDFLSQTTSLEIQTSDSLSLWLDLGLVQSKTGQGGVPHASNEQQWFLAILRSVRITSYSEPTQKKSTVNITVVYETRKKGFLLKTRPSKLGRKGRVVEEEEEGKSWIPFRLQKAIAQKQMWNGKKKKKTKKANSNKFWFGETRRDCGKCFKR